jgi:Dna[CI] antecedent, DciA
MGDLADRWPGIVGVAIARNAWPSRVGRDGTLHVNTTDSVWAFELGHQAAEIAGRLGVPAVRFSPGPLAGREEAAPIVGVPLPSVEQRRAAMEIAEMIEDEDLREKVQKAVSLGLARGCDDPTV